jgi:uncharacterized protein YdhG (YjbR/CyaY superfamily)
MRSLTYSTHEEYHELFDESIKSKLIKIQKAIAKALPKAQKVISYHMPAFKTSEVLIYYAGFKKHISIFPTSSAVNAFEHELKDFVISKGTIQIQLDQELPLKLISEIAKFRDEEVNLKIEMSKVKTTCKKGHTYFKSLLQKTCPECKK